VSNKEVLDLLHLLNLWPVLLGDQAPGFIFVLNARDEQALAVLAFDMLAGSRRSWALLGCRGAIGLYFARNRLLGRGVDRCVVGRLRCCGLGGLLGYGSRCWGRSTSCRLVGLDLLWDRRSGNGWAGLLGSAGRRTTRTALSW
jgi:hypothetical protein